MYAIDRIIFGRGVRRLVRFTKPQKCAFVSAAKVYTSPQLKFHDVQIGYDLAVSIADGRVCVNTHGIAKTEAGLKRPESNACLTSVRNIWVPLTLERAPSPRTG